MPNPGAPPPSPLQMMVSLLEARREALKDENTLLHEHNRAMREWLTCGVGGGAGSYGRAAAHPASAAGAQQQQQQQFMPQQQPPHAVTTPCGSCVSATPSLGVSPGTLEGTTPTGGALGIGSTPPWSGRSTPASMPPTRPATPSPQWQAQQHMQQQLQQPLQGQAQQPTVQ